MRRNTLFWRMLAVGVLPLAVLYIYFYASGADSFIHDHLVFVLLTVAVWVAATYWISRTYTRPIHHLTHHLDDARELTRYFFREKTLPAEIQHLYRSIMEVLDKRQQEQENIQSEKAIFTSILASMNDGILVVDETNNVTLINQAAGSIFNVTKESALGKSLVEVIRHFKMNELLEKTRESGTPQIDSFETAPDKNYIRCIATPLSEGMPGSILFLMQDLTRIRQLEIIRRDFVSNVSHELRTPLTSLKLITETLQDGMLDDPQEAAKFLDRMSGEIDNLSQMVEELLELSRIESGRVPLEKSWVRPKEILEGAQERMLLQVQRAGLTCTLDCLNLPAIFVDKTRLESVVVNLLHNAIKFTRPGGSITLSADRSLNTIVFSVKDSGIGIPPKDLARVFERFYKSDRSRSERGTGLGLSIARHLVEAHGGKIWAESQVNQGSTFSFSIPIR
ncbi:MAG: two-component system, OmpR family, phosphate regulon sensor histidine kinase PhoR [Chloroflexota bacterium]|nr:two-component system, OmpR family, phosphate regulon sensor histidine kinase PhoR [Chloroflexota bacterium]